MSAALVESGRALPARARWFALHARRRTVQLVCSRFYRDPGRDMSRALLVAGSGRSGTTWLTDIIASQVPCRLMWEPFDPAKVEDLAGEPGFPYRRPDGGDDALLRFARTVLDGSLRHPYVDRRVERLLPRYRLVKAIRINLCLGWLKTHFPAVRQVLVIRHPCAVVASRLRAGWGWEGDLYSILRQPRFHEDYGKLWEGAIRAASTPEEHHAVLWCIQNAVPLRQFEPHELTVTFYERLCREPGRELRRVFGALGLTYEETAEQASRQPSLTTKVDSAVFAGTDRVMRWKQLLSAAQVERILRVVSDFRLEHLYGDSMLPRDSTWTGDRP